MTDYINNVPVNKLVEFLESGITESQRVAIRNSLVDDDGHEDDLYKFANRMSVRLNTAIKRIKQLESQAAQDSWEGYVDRQSGAFTQEEIARHLRETW